MLSLIRSISKTLNTSQRAGLLVAFLVLIAGSIISALTYSHLHDQLEQEHLLQSQRELQHLAALLIPSLIRDDRISLNLTLTDWDNGPYMPAIRLFNADGSLLASKGSSNALLVRLTVDIRQDDTFYGTVEGFVSKTPVTMMAKRYGALAIMVTAILSLVSAIVSWFLADRHNRYLNQLEKHLCNWKDGSQLRLPKSPQNPDLASLHQALAQIASRDNQKRAVEEALDQFMGGHDLPFPDPMKYFNCALLFIEIQDLELLQQRLSAEDLSHTLNQYHRLLSQAAKLYNGKVDRFLGDGIVMLFGIPNHDANAAMHCLYAARLFTGLVDHVREHSPDLLPLEFNIAAHWGPVLMAPLQDDVSTQYSLIGDTVHWASHLAHQSEERRVIVSQNMIEMMENGYDIIWKEGPVINDFHGGEQPSYWLDQLPEKTESLIQRQIQHITSMTENV